MSWWAILALAALAYGCKLFGLVILGPRGSDATLADVVQLLPPALFAAIVMTNTFDDGGELVVDARLVGLVVATIAAWRRAPFIVVVGLAMAATALSRQIAS